MKYLLTILFLNLANEPVILDGWHPIKVESKEHCEQAKQRAEKYLDLLFKDGMVKNTTGYEVTCTPIKIN